MKVYVMRHGTTVWNEKGIIQGHCANRLSKNGKTLVASVAEKFKNEKFDVIFSSPLMRTMQTANIMNATHKAKIIKDKRLIEVDKGIFTARAKETLTKEEILLREQNDKSCKMESYENVFSRTMDFLEFLKKQQYSSVLIVTHGIVATMLSDVLEGKKIDFNDSKKLSRFANAEVKSFNL